MAKFYIGRLLQDYDVNTNDFEYKKDQEIVIAELDSFENNYAIYYNLPQQKILDWIPKSIVEILRG